VQQTGRSKYRGKEVMFWWGTISTTPLRVQWNGTPFQTLRDPARSTDSFRSAQKTYLFAALRYE